MELKIYKCKHCGKEFYNRYKLTGHSTHCNSNPNRLTQCNFNNSSKNEIRKIDEPLECYCQYCNKQCKSINSLRQHEIRCKENPNHLEIISNFIAYNKSENKEFKNHYDKANKLGLPKPELSKESKIKIGSTWRGKHLPEEMKIKISDSQKIYYSEHPDKVPFKLNHSSKISKPEQYFIEVFEKENIPLKYHKQVSRYELDFYNEDLMKYVEIDGEQHYFDWMIKHDIERTEFLKNLGWEGIRIRWSEYQSLSYEDKHNKIEEIRNFIK